MSLTDAHKHQLTLEALRLGLNRSAVLIDKAEDLPAPLPAVAANVPSTTPAHFAALVRASVETPRAADTAALFRWLETRPFEASLLAFDLLSFQLADDVSQSSWKQTLAAHRELLPSPPSRAIALNEEVVWLRLPEVHASTTDAALEAAVENLDLAALAEKLRRGRPIDDKEIARWIHFAELLAMAHFDTWSSAVAGLLARECGSLAALAIWSDAVGNETLLYPSRIAPAISSSIFGPARERVDSTNMRLLHQALRQRRANGNSSLAAITEVLQMPIPPGGELVAALRLAAAQIEGAVQTKIPVPRLDEVARTAILFPSCAYARWACLQGFAATPDSTALPLVDLIDEYRNVFGGVGLWYDQIARYAVSHEILMGLAARLIGDLLANPDRPSLWCAFAMFAGNGKESIDARNEVLARLESQLV